MFCEDHCYGRERGEHTGLAKNTQHLRRAHTHTPSVRSLLANPNPHTPYLQPPHTVPPTPINLSIFIISIHQYINTIYTHRVSLSAPITGGALIAPAHAPPYPKEVTAVMFVLLPLHCHVWCDKACCGSNLCRCTC